MEKHRLTPETLLGRIVTTKEGKYQVVHLSLKEGNEVPDFKMDVHIVILVMSGNIRLIAGEEEMELQEQDMVEVEPNREHKMVALSDSQVFAIKVF